MQKIFSLFLLIVITLSTYAAKKPQQAIVNIVTYSVDGSLLASGNGFFIDQTGRTVAPYGILKNAVRAEVIDAKGKVYEVARIVGVNSTYDLAVLTIQTKKKSKFDYFSIAKDSAKTNEALTCYPYTVKKAKPITAKVIQSQPFDTLRYYTTSVPNENRYFGCPLLNEAGDVVAVVQQNVADSAVEACAIDARFIPTLRVTSTSAFNRDLRSVKIPKLLPATEREAHSYILMLDAADSLVTATAYQDFLMTYPQNADGYMDFATFYVNHANYEQAEACVKLGFEQCAQHDILHYSWSKMIYQMVRGGVSYNDWTAQKSADEAAAAYALNPQPLYRLQQGHSLFLQGDFEHAKQCFSDVCATDIVSAETHYLMAKCILLQGGDSIQALAQMDSAVNRLMPPVPKNAAFYILERAHLLSEMGQYRKAVFDYNNYEGIMTPKMLTDRFYALRAQVELNAKMYQQALDDMLYAQTLAPKNAYYPQECARIYFIVGSYNEAITQAQKSLVLHPENLEAYRIMGLAYYQLGEKTSAQQIFKKLIEAGDESLKKYME